MTKSEQQKPNAANKLSFLNERYCDVALLGSGGMGRLYRAFDSVLNKPVAIKVLSSKHPDNKMILRFQQEAKLASRLQHTNIVNILDFGAGSEQELYLIMDLVEGKTLEEFIEAEGPLPIATAVPLIMQICDALTHAHNKGVVHRDIKPSNIMIAGDKQTGLSVRIVDFGLAILQSRDVRITQTGDTIGTPLYISPEQIKGEDVDFRADVYALGCVIFTILSGHPPFRGEMAFDTFQKHLHSPIPSLADASVSISNVEELDSILERLLAKSPAHRYQNLSELKEDLSVLLPPEANGILTLNEASAMALTSTSTRIPKWAVALVLLLVIGVPLLVMSFEVNKPLAKVPKINQLKLEQTSLFSSPKEQNASRLFYERDKGRYRYMDCRIVDEDLAYLKGKGVIDLDLDTTKVQGWGLQYLKNEPLTTLNMPESKITDENLHWLNELKRLESLKLGYTWITLAGLKTLTPNANLRVISLEGCRKLDDRSVPELIRIAPNLETINLTFMPITKVGLEHLKNAKKLTCLTLANNEFTDEDLSLLAEMKSLQLIDLSKCKKVTDKTIKVLAKEKNLSKLRVIDCPLISSAALDKLQKAYPKMQIDRTRPTNQKKIYNFTKIFCTTDDNRLPDLDL